MAHFLNKVFRRRRYGGYELIEQVARGGMSRIWKARHPESGEIRALKILTPESIELMDRFKEIFEAEEGEVALRMDHPNVIKTFEYGRRRRAEYYIVMEYVDGPNLETLVYLRSSAVVENRLDVILQLGAGLRYIHNQGLIHRDFCPKNALYGDDHIAKIIDFGLTIPEAVKERAAVGRAGTASYMAPEQVRGRAVDVRTDIYAFGLSLFTILTGVRPFPRAADHTRRMQDQLNLQPQPLTRVAPELPEELGEVIRRCVEKNMEVRYKSMDEAMKDLNLAVEIARKGS
jgi:serine/threonine protein kinase